MLCHYELLFDCYLTMKYLHKILIKTTIQEHFCRLTLAQIDEDTTKVGSKFNKTADFSFTSVFPSSIAHPSIMGGDIHTVGGAVHMSFEFYS